MNDMILLFKSISFLVQKYFHVMFSCVRWRYVKLDPKCNQVAVIVLFEEIARRCHSILSGGLTSGYFTSWIGQSIFECGVSILRLLFILQMKRLTRKEKDRDTIFTIGCVKLWIAILFWFISYCTLIIISIYIISNAWKINALNKKQLLLATNTMHTNLLI